MIHLEHVNLIVRDIEETLTFYRAAFPHWSVRGGDKGEWSGKPRNWIHFGDDYQYLAFGDNGVGENRDLAGHQVGLAHFAYVTDDITGVIKRLADAGFSIAKDGMDDEYRQNIYFLDPNGYEVEFVQYNTDVPNLRNRY
ncbi:MULTISPECIES: VOC family protein [unclassified Moritella]|uniref:VOC family protein n=1 Tax=unclassified Moritella TaxID=2637987 RepID=UPI001BAA7B84|nr:MULTISPECIES: VOC family protein [unclassified Moritella]QUM86007.1 VOC family protein [Moritella sp. 28]QUM90229.1 VOC family protein [Moritella sp. 36]